MIAARKTVDGWAVSDSELETSTAPGAGLAAVLDAEFDDKGGAVVLEEGFILIEFALYNLNPENEVSAEYTSGIMNYCVAGARGEPVRFKI